MGGARTLNADAQISLQVLANKLKCYHHNPQNFYFKTGPLQCLCDVPQRLNVLSYSY